MEGESEVITGPLAKGLTRRFMGRAKHVTLAPTMAACLPSSTSSGTPALDSSRMSCLRRDMAKRTNEPGSYTDATMNTVDMALDMTLVWPLPASSSKSAKPSGPDLLR